MINNPKKLFEALYKILQEIWRETQAEDLRVYLSDADPLLCGDGISADPVVSEDFDNLYKNKKNSQISDYDFLIYYLENLDPYYGDIKKYFTSIPRDVCESKIASMEN